MNNQYYILDDEENQLGPFTYNELIERDIDMHTQVLGATNEWQYASEMPEFYNYFKSKGIHFPTGDNIAGIGWRILALFIDFILLGIVVELVAVKFGWLKLPADLEHITMPSADEAMIIQGMFLGLYLIYNTLLELTPWKGGVGKKICGLRVVDANGQNLSFFKSAGRNLGVILSIILSYIPFLSVFINEHKQAWYDKLTDAYMIKV